MMALPYGKPWGDPWYFPYFQYPNIIELGDFISYSHTIQYLKFIVVSYLSAHIPTAPVLTPPPPHHTPSQI